MVHRNKSLCHVHVFLSHRLYMSFLFFLFLYLRWGRGVPFLEPRRDGIRRIVNGYPVEVANFLPGQFNRPLIGRPTFTSVDSTSVRAPANPLIRAALREPSLFREAFVATALWLHLPETFFWRFEGCETRGWMDRVGGKRENYSHIERSPRFEFEVSPFF